MCTQEHYPGIEKVQNIAQTQCDVVSSFSSLVPELLLLDVVSQSVSQVFIPLARYCIAGALLLVPERWLWNHHGLWFRLGSTPRWFYHRALFVDTPMLLCLLVVIHNHPILVFAYVFPWGLDHKIMVVVWMFHMQCSGFQLRFTLYWYDILYFFSGLNCQQVIFESVVTKLATTCPGPIRTGSYRYLHHLCLGNTDVDCTCCMWNCRFLTPGAFLAMMLYWALLSDLAIFSMRISAFATGMDSWGYLRLVGGSDALKA